MQFTMLYKNCPLLSLQLSLRPSTLSVKSMWIIITTITPSTTTSPAPLPAKSKAFYSYFLLVRTCVRVPYYR